MTEIEKGVLGAILLEELYTPGCTRHYFEFLKVEHFSFEAAKEILKLLLCCIQNKKL